MKMTAGKPQVRSQPVAIEGGTPVRSCFLPFGIPCLGPEEEEEVLATIRSGWIGTGPRVQRFESEFAAYVGAEHAVALNSCTAALFLSLVALGVGSGDEVITTPLSFAATANVIENVGARPIFADVDPITLNIDPGAVERAITPRTRAIMPVHFGGLPCDLDALHEIASRHGLALIEDAAHAVGARYRGRMIGARGNLTCFSFYANKNLTTAEGGMLTTNDSAIADKARILRLHGLGADAWKRFSSRRLVKSDILLPGYKFNMTDVTAAMGIPQLRKQEGFLSTREAYALRYDKAFSSLAVLFQPRPSPSSGDRHALHLYLLLLQSGYWSATRDRVIDALIAENIGAALHYRPIHTHPFYRSKYGFHPDDFPRANDAGHRILSLPLSPAMNDRDLADVIEAVHRVSARYCR